MALRPYVPRVKKSSGWNPFAKHYVYRLFDVADGKTRYIGVTYDLKHRLSVHRSARKNTMRDRWIKSVIRSGSQIDMEVIYEGMWFSIPSGERYYIKLYIEMGCDLVNTALVDKIRKTPMHVLKEKFDKAIAAEKQVKENQS